MRVIFLIDPEDELNCQNIKINFYEKHIDTNNRYQVINFMHNSIEPNILSALLRQSRHNQNMKINVNNFGSGGKYRICDLARWNPARSAN